MGQFLRINGDYNISAVADPTNGGKITLYTGPNNTGEVRITGNLVVEGTTLTVVATNLDVTDNIITVNNGETGDGVTLQYSGLQVDRGFSSPGIDNLPAAFVWNENMPFPNNGAITNESGGWQIGFGDGSYNFTNSRLMVKEIMTPTAAAGTGDLTLIGRGRGIVTVLGTDDYEQQVLAFGDDAIPNKKYVDDAIRDNPTFQIITDSPADPLNPLPNSSTRVIATDKDIADLGNGISSLDYFYQNTGYLTFGESAVSILVDGVLNTQFYKNRAVIQGLEFIGNEITNNDTSANISIRTQGTGKLQTNYALQLEQLVGNPSYVPGYTLLRAGDPSIGTTGLYFVNDSSETIKQTGELISKNKALLFSMLF